MSCPGDNYVVPGANPCAGGGGGGGAGVSSIDGLTGDVAVTSNDGSITINNITGGLNLEVTNPAAVTSIVAGTNVTINPPTGLGAVTINASAPVTTLVAGAGVVLDPPSGIGNVTVSAPVANGNAGGYYQAGTAVTSLQNSVQQKIFGITFTLAQSCIVFVTAKLNITNTNTTPPSGAGTIVATYIIIDDGLGPNFPSYATVDQIQPLETRTIINTGMCPLPAGSFTLWFEAITDGLTPDFSVTVNAQNPGSLNLMTNLLQNSTHPVTYYSPTIGPFTNITLNGASPPAIQSPGFTLPIINAAWNSTVTITLTMSGSGYTNSILGNSIEIGMYQGPLTFIGGYTQSSTPMAPFDLGTSIPAVGVPINPLNLVTTFTIPIATYQAGNFAPGWDLALSGAVFFMDNLNFRVSITYNA